MLHVSSGVSFLNPRRIWSMIYQLQVCSANCEIRQSDDPTES